MEMPRSLAILGKMPIITYSVIPNPSVPAASANNPFFIIGPQVKDKREMSMENHANGDKYGRHPSCRRDECQKPFFIGEMSRKEFNTEPLIVPVGVPGLFSFHLHGGSH